MSHDARLRLGVDVSKIVHSDGIGSFVRGLVVGLDQVLRRDDCPRGDGPRVDIRFYDPLGILGSPGEADDVLRDALSPVFSPVLAGGELDERFESRLGRSPSPDEIDVLLVTGWRTPPTWRGPTLFVVYDLTFLSHPRCHTIDNRIHCLEGVLGALLAEAKLVSISSSTGRELERRFGLERSDYGVVTPGVDPTFRAVDPETTRERLGERFGLDPGYVLAVGSLEPRKNLERLVAAHAALDDELRSAHPLVVVGGGGWRNAELTLSLDEAEAQGHVHRLGRVSTEDLVTLYGAADLFAYPSLAEGFGLPVVEAMACGTAVLTSELSSLPEAAGDAARLVDPLDVDAIRRALDELLRDEGARGELVEAGLSRVEELSWRRSAEEFLALAEEIR